MVKRSLLAAQKGSGSLIRGLRVMHLSTNTVEPLPVVVKEPTDEKKRKNVNDPKKPRKKSKLEQDIQIKNIETTNAETTCIKNSIKTKNPLIENIYGAEEAAKKRRMMESKTLEKVTTVREAFEVCLFKAERAESDAEKTKIQLQQAIDQLEILRKQRVKTQDIIRCEEQIRQLRAKITKARALHQTPIDVIANVAKFSLLNSESNKEDTKQEEESADLKENKKNINVGSIATISLLNTKEILQNYLQSLQERCNEKKLQVSLPKMQYNWCNPFAVKLAKQFVQADALFPLKWELATYEIDFPSKKTEKLQEKREKKDKKDYDDEDNDKEHDDEEDEEEEEEDDDDIFDDSLKNAWLKNNKIDCVESLLLKAEFSNHPESHSWDEIEQERHKMQAECAKVVANRLMSLFFKDNSNLLDEKESSNLQATLQDIRGAPQKKEISLVKIGQLQKSAAIGGKTRNRVHNKMKPARNTENVSIMNFLRVQMHERSDKHVAAASFIEYMQNFEKQRGEKGNSHSMFSNFVNSQEKKANTTTSGPVVGSTLSSLSLENSNKKRKLEALIGDCNNAAESLPLPNYASPKCVACGAPVHISKRTGMETCTSPSCAATVYRPTGFEVVHLEQQIHNTYQYLLTVHMKSTLRRVQGKESAMVPKRVKDAVKERLEMERVDISQLTPKKVKEVLKKLDLSAWYNHRQKICAAIANKKPYQFTAEEEDIILAVFERLIEPYNLYRPKTDENFPYYRYALHKILQLLGYPTDVLRDFPILKSRKNHQRKEAIWAKMMKFRGWPVYKS